MSTKEKLIERFKKHPKDFTFDEFKTMLYGLGFEMRYQFKKQQINLIFMNNLEYKGYYGSIEYSKEDKRLYGKVLGMTKDSITYEGNTVDELENDFTDAIESYLEGCMELGIKPRRGFNGVLNIRIPSEIHSRIALYAEDNGTSINAFVRDSIEKRLESAITL